MHLVILHHTDCAGRRCHRPACPAAEPARVRLIYDVSTGLIEIVDPVAGGAADPIALEPVDVVVTALVGNVYDALLTSDDTITRAMVTNADRLGLDLSGVHAVVLSHGHFDHAGGLAGLAERRYPVLADGCPPAGVDSPPARPARRGRRLAGIQQACTDRRGLRRDRAPPAVPARRWLHPDHR